MTIENILNVARKKVSITGLALFLGVGGFFGYEKYSEHTKRNNLELNAFWVGGDQFEIQYGRAFLKNKDLNGNGRYETVIRYIDRNGKYRELKMIMTKEGFPQVVIPKRE
ncbi:hypothetical protein HYX17_02920 [Candidatus Woesearchaeota archaeon]|nr:hypothetical protein [Candidatus Woesearchaeota archaeon]